MAIQQICTDNCMFNWLWSNKNITHDPIGSKERTKKKILATQSSMSVTCCARCVFMRVEAMN